MRSARRPSRSTRYWSSLTRPWRPRARAPRDGRSRAATRRRALPSPRARMSRRQTRRTRSSSSWTACCSTRRRMRLPFRTARPKAASRIRPATGLSQRPSTYLTASPRGSTLRILPGRARPRSPTPSPCGPRPAPTCPSRSTRAEIRGPSPAWWRGTGRTPTRSRLAARRPSLARPAAWRWTCRRSSTRAETRLPPSLR